MAVIASSTAIEPVVLPAHDMQDRAEDLSVEPKGLVDLEDAGCEEGAVLGPGRQRALVDQPGLPRHPRAMLLQDLPGRARR